MEEKVREALGDCPVCFDQILDPPIYQCQNNCGHPLCFTCWDKLYKEGHKCPTCRAKLTDKRNFPLENLLEQIVDKKKCKFDGCPFEKNNLELVTRHEENCIHRTFKCKWSELGCNFEASDKTLVTEHEDDCEHNLSQELESGLSFAGVAEEVKPKRERKTRKAEAPPKLMPNGLCWKHHKYGDRAHTCDLPSRCVWDNDFMLPSTSGPSFEHRENNALDTERSICKFHGCSFRNEDTRKLKKHEMTKCPFAKLSFQDYEDAAVNGDINNIRNMVEFGRDKNPADKKGTTPLHKAATNGHVEVVRLIMQNVNDKNPANKEGVTPLHGAAISAHVEVAELIMQNIDEKNPADKSGRTPLHDAAQDGHIEIVLLILDNVNEKNPADKKGSTPLHFAAHFGHVDIVQLILHNVDEKSPVDKKGCTPLHWAALEGHAEVVRMILDYVDDKHPKTPGGKTPLQFAIESQHSSVVQLFSE